MEKKTLIATVLAVLLIVGAIFVSAALENEEVSEEVEEQQVCGAQTCNQQCGGSCGVPKCGCGK